MASAAREGDSSCISRTATQRGCTAPRNVRPSDVHAAPARQEEASKAAGTLGASQAPSSGTEAVEHRESSRGTRAAAHTCARSSTEARQHGMEGSLQPGTSSHAGCSQGQQAGEGHRGAAARRPGEAASRLRDRLDAAPAARRATAHRIRRWLIVTRDRKRLPAWHAS